MLFQQLILATDTLWAWGFTDRDAKNQLEESFSRTLTLHAVILMQYKSKNIPISHLCGLHKNRFWTEMILCWRPSWVGVITTCSLVSSAASSCYVLCIHSSFGAGQGSEIGPSQ